MAARVIGRDGDEITIAVTVKVNGPMLHAEEAILTATNEVGTVATAEALKQFDADGEPIILGDIKWYARETHAKYYQTPYGEVIVNRWVYQKAGGGKTFCPLEHGARILRNATPRLAKMVSHKLAQEAALDVQRDLEENHGRPTSKLLVQELGAYVSAVVQAKEENWTYATPMLEADIATVGIGIDGSCMLMCEGQWREAMTGSISLYDRAGERQHTIYVGAAPEHGKTRFHERMAREIAHVRQLYPEARYVGIADGAQSNWDFLAPHVDEQILDFYHATEYVTRVADALFGSGPPQARHAWLEAHCSMLKNDWNGAATMLQEWEAIDGHAWNKARRQALGEGIRYFRNHLHQMHYKRYGDMGMPIGSGVTEAACKTLVKQRLCQSGMRWKEKGAQVILSLRALLLTQTRWSQFWRKLEQYGAPVLDHY